MRFWKMHGLGNDYIVIDDRGESISEKEIPEVVKRLCRRHFSIGADGLLLVRNSKIADIKMRIFNSDGSEAEMCGNGIRCFAKYCDDNGIVPTNQMDIETLAGTRRVKVLTEGKRMAEVRVDMGPASFRRKDVPMVGHGECVNEPITINGKPFKVTCVSMGNPHCVLFVDNLESFPVYEVGSQLEKHELFPQGTNVEFVTIQSRDTINVRTWERGVGETTACGTGACASVAVANRLGKSEKKVRVNLVGGSLLVELNHSVTLEGPVEKVFEGQLFSDD